MIDVDYLVVGQGLAGTVLADALLRKEKKIMIIDHPKPVSASRIASGIMNPITGRRFVKSWMFEELLPIALRVYSDLERMLGSRFLHQRNILRTITDQGAHNDWLARTVQEEYAPYVVSESNRIPFSNPSFQPLGNVIETTGSYQLDIPNLIEKFTLFLEESNSYRAERLDHSKLEFEGTSIVYKGVRARAIVFCEGHALTENPLFAINLLHPSIGERLIINCSDLIIDKLIKKKYFLAPLFSGDHWYGSDTHWNFDQLFPSNSARETLLKALDSTIKSPYQLVSHEAAIRPTVRDRRPILGRHPQIENVYIFNGLGTKGASLAPFWSQVLVKHLTQNKPIPEEVSIQRFFK